MVFHFSAFIASFVVQTASRTLSLITSSWYKQKSQKEPPKRLTSGSKSLVEVTRDNQKLVALQAEGQKQLAAIHRERNDIEMTRIQMEKAIAIAEHGDRQKTLALQAQLVDLKNRELRLTQQLAREEQIFRARESELYRDLLRELKTQEIDVKLREVQTHWDAIEKNWPSRLNRHDTEELLLKGRNQYPLLLLVAPPNISRSCPASFQDNLPQELRNHLKQFVREQYAENSLYPVEFYGDYFNRDIFDIDVKQLKNVLAPLPSVVIYCDITDREVYFHVGIWGWIDVEPVEIASMPWNWREERKRLEAQGEEVEECLYQLRLQILNMYKVLAAFLADWYYLNLDRNYSPHLLQIQSDFPSEWLTSQLELLEAVYHHNQAWNAYDSGLQALRLKLATQAVSYFEQALQLSKEFPEAHLLLGIALCEAGNYAAAEQQLAGVLAVQPQESIALNYYGLSLLKSGQLDKALACFEQLVELQADCADSWQHLGETLTALGREKLAQVLVAKAKNLPPCSNGVPNQEIQVIEPPKPKAGDVFRDKLKDGSLGPEMVIVPAGKFNMGSNKGGEDSEKPIHEVTIAYDFSVGKYPVTFEEYDRFCEAIGREKPSDSSWGRGKRPVINVNWNDAKAYCQWLSEQTGKKYRLLTEAEWEYACRAGSTGKYCFGNDVNQLKNYGWYDNNSGSQTHPVGEKKPNAWGLYDMHGNVWEWCEDLWHSDYQGAPTDGSAWVSGGTSDTHPLRGGSWYSYGAGLRCASRLGGFTTSGSFDGGLRLSRM